MKVVQTILVLALVASNVTAQINGDKLLGVYWSPKKDAKIQFYKKGEQYFGKTIWAASPKKDINNPDVALRTRDLLGLDILTSFSFEDEQYTGGLVYDPANGKTYKCKISFSGSNLKVRGYIGISLLGRTEIFERIP